MLYSSIVSIRDNTESSDLHFSVGYNGDGSPFPSSPVESEIVNIEGDYFIYAEDKWAASECNRDKTFSWHPIRVSSESGVYVKIQEGAEALEWELPEDYSDNDYIHITLDSVPSSYIYARIEDGKIKFSQPVSGSYYLFRREKINSILPEAGRLAMFEGVDSALLAYFGGGKVRSILSEEGIYTPELSETKIHEFFPVHPLSFSISFIPDPVKTAVASTITIYDDDGDTIFTTLAPLGKGDTSLSVELNVSELLEPDNRYHVFAIIMYSDYSTSHPSEEMVVETVGDYQRLPRPIIKDFGLDVRSSGMHLYTLPFSAYNLGIDPEDEILKTAKFEITDTQTGNVIEEIVVLAGMNYAGIQLSEPLFEKGRRYSVRVSFAIDIESGETLNSDFSMPSSFFVAAEIQQAIRTATALVDNFNKIDLLNSFAFQETDETVSIIANIGSETKILSLDIGEERAYSSEDFIDLEYQTTSPKSAFASFERELYTLNGNSLLFTNNDEITQQTLPLNSESSVQQFKIRATDSVGERFIGILSTDGVFVEVSLDTDEVHRHFTLPVAPEFFAYDPNQDAYIFIYKDMGSESKYRVFLDGTELYVSFNPNEDIFWLSDDSGRIFAVTPKNYFFLEVKEGSIASFNSIFNDGRVGNALNTFSFNGVVYSYNTYSRSDYIMPFIFKLV